MKRLRLLIVDGSEVVERTFSELPVRIGRHPSNECQILDDQVSRFHAQVQCDGNALILRDVDSQNGTALVEGGDGAVRVLRAAEARSTEGSLTFFLGSVRIQAKIEAVGRDELPVAFAPAARAATEALLEVCVSRGLPLCGSDPSPETLRAVIDALFGNLLRIRTALHSEELQAEGEGGPQASRGDGTSALLEWAQATTLALRAVDLALEKRWPLAPALAQAAADVRKSGIRLRHATEAATQAATGSDRGERLQPSGLES
jgi:hypothetical protein